jgi:hypothetical protein
LFICVLIEVKKSPHQRPHGGEVTVDRQHLTGDLAASGDSSQSIAAAPSRIAGSFSMPCVIGVSVMPGATALMRRPCAA